MKLSFNFATIMGIGMTIIGTLIILFIIQYIFEKRKEDEDYDRFVQEAMSKPKEDKTDGDELNDSSICLDDRTTTGLVLTTLRSIGCRTEIEVHNNTNWIRFTYQGEHFMIQCSDDCNIISIYDTWWYQISIYSDVEEIAELHKTINLANQYGNCTLLYTTDKEIEQIGVHSKREILFIKEIPQIDKYLISIIMNFFKVQRFVLTELEKCKVTENN